MKQKIEEFRITPSTIMSRAPMYAGTTHDPFEKIDQISISKVDYWVEQLNEEGFDADKVAEIFFATKKESEISSTLSKITSLQDNIEKILRAQVTSNYMTFIKARDTIKQTGLEMSELRALVDKTSELIQDVRNNRLGASKTMRRNSMMGVVNTLANAPKLGEKGVEHLMDGAGLRKRGDSSSSESSYSELDSMDSNLSSDSDEESSPKPAKRPVSTRHKHEHDVDDLLGQYESSADPYAVPDWLPRAPDELSRLIVERSYSAAVKLVMRTREYGAHWETTYTRDKGLYKEAKERGESEDLLSLHGLSKDERKAAVNKQNKVMKVVESIEAKQLHLAHTLMSSMVELPHSPIWGMEEQRKRLRMLITLGHHNLAAEAFSKSRMNIIQVVLRDVEASGDPKVYITDICKGFYGSMLDVTMSFLQLFSKHAHTPSIMSILIVWAHYQTAALVEALMQQVRLAAKEYSALAIFHLKPKIATGLYSKSNVTSAVNSPMIDGDRKRQQLMPSSPMQPDEQPAQRNPDDYFEPIAYPPTYMLDEDLRSFVGPLKFTRDCINIALQQASDMNATGMQGFAELSWLMLPQLKKLVNAYSEDLIKETINQVRLDTWLGMRPRAIKIFPPSTLVNPQAAGVERTSYVGRGSLSVIEPDAVITASLGASFDWLTVCLTHFVDDVWCLLRVQNSKNGVMGAENRNGSDGNSSSDNDEARPHHGDSSGDNDYVPSEDEEGSNDDEIDPATGKPLYRRPAYRRVNLSEIEPIAVTSILRIILHYVLELERLDMAAEQYQRHSDYKQVLLDTCSTLREITIPSVLTFIQDVLFNLRMVSVLGNSDNDAFGQAPGAILTEISAKLSAIEATIRNSGHAAA